MKKYKVETVTHYTDYNDDNIPYDDNESFVFFIMARTLSSAKKKAIVKTKELFNIEYDIGYENIRYEIADIYETTLDARL